MLSDKISITSGQPPICFLLDGTWCRGSPAWRVALDHPALMPLAHGGKQSNALSRFIRPCPRDCYPGAFAAFRDPYSSQEPFS